MKLSSILANQSILTFSVRGSGVILSTAATAFVARMLQPERFGDYAFVLAIIMIATVATSEGLGHTVVRETAYVKAREKQSLLSGIWVWAFRTAFLATLVTAAGIAGWAVFMVTDPGLQRNLLTGIVVLFILPIPQVICGGVQGLSHIVLSQIPRYIIRPLVTLGLVAPLWLTSQQGMVSVLTMLVIFALSILAESIVGGIFLFRKSSFSIREGLGMQKQVESRKLVMATISFGAIASVQLLNSNLDILMLGFFDAGTGTGLYRAAIALSALVTFGLLVVNSIIMPLLAGLHANGSQEELQRLITKSVRLITALSLIGALCLFLGGKFFLGFLFGDAYLDAHTVLIILVFGQFSNAFFGPVALILNMTGNEKLTLASVCVTVVVNIVLNYTLIPIYGIEGAAIATAVSMFIWNLILVCVLKWKTGLNSTILNW